MCWDFIVNQIPTVRYCTGGQLGAPLVIKSATGGGSGFGCQHSHAAESWVMAAPGIKIAVPSSPAEFKGQMTAAILDDDPVIVFEPKALYPVKGDVPDGEHVIPLGQAAVLGKGADVTLVGLGSTVAICSRVAETGRAVIVEEGPEQLGWGTTVAAIVAEEAFDVLRDPVRRVAGANVPTPSVFPCAGAGRAGVGRRPSGPARRPRRRPAPAWEPAAGGTWSRSARPCRRIPGAQRSTAGVPAAVTNRPRVTIR